MSKKILCVIISIIIMLSIVPLTVFASENEYKQGDIIEFGSYPQSKVSDENLIDELNNLELKWESIYYCTNGWDTVEECYKYADVDYNNEKYRVITDIETGETNWYIYEPIEWVIIDPKTGYVLCNLVLDNKSFQIDTSKHFTDADWETSYIRSWLNEDFYNAAFSEVQAKSIITTNTDMTVYNDNGENTGYTTVSDNIVLFSLSDALNEDYGYVELNGNPEMNSRYYVVTGKLGRFPSDYAHFLGAIGFEELGDADWADEYKGCKWLLKKNTKNAYRPAHVYPKHNAAYYIDEESGTAYYYGYYDEATESPISAYGDEDGYICLIDYYDHCFAFESLGICPAMHINLATFDKKQVPGDMDGNGEVTPSDARTALRIAAGLDTATDDICAIADIDSNGTVTPADARKILRIAAGLE